MRVVVPGQGFDDVGRQVPGSGDAAPDDRVGRGSQPTQGLGVVVQRRDPVEGVRLAGAVAAAERGGLPLGERRVVQQRPADLLGRVLQQLVDQVWVQAGVAGDVGAPGGVGVADRVFGEEPVEPA